MPLSKTARAETGASTSSRWSFPLGIVCAGGTDVCQRFTRVLRAHCEEPGRFRQLQSGRARIALPCRSAAAHRKCTGNADWLAKLDSLLDLHSVPGADS